MFGIIPRPTLWEPLF